MWENCKENINWEQNHFVQQFGQIKLFKIKIINTELIRYKIIIVYTKF